MGAATLALCAAGCGASAPTHAKTVAVHRVSACDLLDPATIESITHLKLAAGVPTKSVPDAGWTICNWEDHSAGSAVQLQLRIGHGQTDFVQRRHDIEGAHLGALRTVSIPGATNAFDIKEQGLVDVVASGDFLQLSTVGEQFDQQEHLTLVEAAVKRLP